jgi:hypothetical protein
MIGGSLDNLEFPKISQVLLSTIVPWATHAKVVTRLDEIKLIVIEDTVW